MRNNIRNLVLNILGMFKKPSPGIHILNGHYISRETKDQNVFAELLTNLQKKVTFIRIEEAVDLIEKKSNLNHPALAFTFDDGFEECYTKIAPVLRNFKTNAAFFLNPNFIDGDNTYREEFLSNRIYIKNKNPMTWEMVKFLQKDGFIIGSHTMDHLRLNISDENILRFQMEDCKKTIEEKIKFPCEYFAYPYGQENDISQKALQIAGENYKYIFTGFNHKKYFSFDNKAFNRRHFEGDWPLLHMNYFLSFKKEY